MGVSHVEIESLGHTAHLMIDFSGHLIPQMNNVLVGTQSPRFPNHTLGEDSTLYYIMILGNFKLFL